MYRTMLALALTFGLFAPNALAAGQENEETGFADAQADHVPPSNDSLTNVAQGKPYTITQGFRDEDLMAYETRTAADNGSAYELTDGKIASSKQHDDYCNCDVMFLDKNWIGFNRQVNRSVVIDLGEPKYVDSVVGGFLQERTAAVELPRYIKFALSNDNVNWFRAGDQKPVYSDSQQASRKEIVQNGINAAARYVKVEFEVGMFTFADEIQVLGRDAKTADRQANKLPREAAPAPDDPPTVKQAGGVKHMYISYYYPVGGGNEMLGKWTKEDYKSVIAHTNLQGERTGWMFDTILFSNGGDVYTEYNTKDKWQTYLDQLFSDNLHISALDQATADAKAALKDPSYRTKVVISIPYPNPNPNAVWGELDGQTVDFDIKNGEASSFEARKRAVEWYIDTAYSTFKAKHYKNLELAGFYWQHEEVGFGTMNEENLVKHVAAKIHSGGIKKKFYWIPFFQSNGSTIWKELGFDAVMMQPNYYFTSKFGPNVESKGKIDIGRLQTTVATAKRFGMGVEVEGDYHMTWKGWGTDWDGQLYNGEYANRKYYAYLNEFKKAGLDQVVTGYYLGARTVLRDIVQDPDPKVRSAYDETSKFIDGTYEVKVPDETEIPLPKGDTWDQPIEIDAVEGDAYTSYIEVSSSKWIKFPIKAGEDWIVTLTPLNGAQFSMETRHWGPAQTKHSGFSYNKASEVQSMLVKNPGDTDTFIMLRVFPDGSPSGKFKISLARPTEDGTTMMNAIDLPNDDKIAGTAVQAGQEIWYKISGKSKYALSLVPDPNADFDVALYWDANSGAAQAVSKEGAGSTKTINYTNGFADQFLYYVKVTAKTAGTFTFYNGITPPGQQPARGTSYADAIALTAADGLAYDSATMNEGLAVDGARWFKFAVAPGEEWEVTLTPTKGAAGSPDSEVAMDMRWVEGPALKWTYSYMSHETEPQRLTVLNEESVTRYAYVRAIAQQMGGNFTLALRKLTPAP